MDIEPFPQGHNVTERPDREVNSRWSVFFFSIAMLGLCAIGSGIVLGNGRDEMGMYAGILILVLGMPIVLSGWIGSAIRTLGSSRTRDGLSIAGAVIPLLFLAGVLLYWWADNNLEWLKLS